MEPRNNPWELVTLQVFWCSCLSRRIVTSLQLGASRLFVSPGRSKVVHKDFGEPLSLTLNT